jgi:ADP-ribose pyrophosphatase YjhB (NUDIX family)
MLLMVQFPITYSASGDGMIAKTFETMAVPPRHDQITAVCGWVYAGGDLLVVHDAEHGWQLPGGERRAGETFHQTLARTMWEHGGALGASRLLGVFKTTDVAGEHAPTYTVCLLAEAREVAPVGDAFVAKERALFEPSMLSTIVDEWDEVMDAALAYAEAIHTPTPVDEDVLAVA